MKTNNVKHLIALLCLILSMSAFADNTFVTIGSLKYKLNGTEAYVSGYVGSPTDVVIPATIESDGLTFKVTKVNSNAFYNCTSITSVKAEGSNLHVIGEAAFQGCTSLVSISFPHIQTIYKRSFYGCNNLQKVWLGMELKYIQGGSQYYGAFSSCSMLPYIIIPASCIDINSYTFEGCSRLQSIIYLGTQTGQCGSNATVYNVNNMVQWSESTFNYSGATPTPTFTSNLPTVFQSNSTSAMSTLEKNAGTYSTTIPITFTNSDISFTADIPYNYTINPLKLTARVKNATKLYGDANPQFQSEYSGFITGENESVITSKGTYSTSATASSAVGTYSVTQSGAMAQNYTFQYEPGTLTIAKAPLTMTPRDKMITYGERVPTLEVDYAGMKNNESIPTWITEPTITTTATQTSNAGTYPITISGGEAKNYNVTYKQGTLTILKAMLTATTKDATRQYGDENPDFELSYNGLKNGDTAPAWNVTPTFATPATKTSPVGTYSISAAGGDAKNYTVQYNNSGQLTVTKSLLTATARSFTKKQGEDNPVLVVDYSGFKNSETKLALTQEPIATTTATKNSRPGTYLITVSGGIAMNYEFTYVNGTLTVLPNDEQGADTQNYLTIENITANKKAQVILPIGMKNQRSISGLQFDLYLPDGVTVATKSNGKMLIETTERMDGSYTVSSNVIDNFVRVVGYSADGDAFRGNSGDILKITLNVDESMAEGNYSVRIKDIVLSDVNNTECHPADVGATITVKSFTLGDVDNSGAVNINDVVCIINYILNKPMGTFIEEAADVDGNGTININDVVTLINRYILMRNNAPMVSLKAPRHAIVDDNYLYLETIDINPNETLEIPMLMTNSNIVAAVQGNIKLPEGLSFVTKSNGRLDVKNIDERSEDFTLSCAIQDDGSMTFAHYSGEGFTYAGNSGGIFTFKIKAAEDAKSGKYQVLLSNVVMSIDGVGYDIANRTSTLNITGTDNIYNYGDNRLVDNYYTLDGRQVSTPQRGVNIIRMNDGKVKKVLVK